MLGGSCNPCCGCFCKSLESIAVNISWSLSLNARLYLYQQGLIDFQQFLDSAGSVNTFSIDGFLDIPNNRTYSLSRVTSFPFLLTGLDGPFRGLNYPYSDECFYYYKDDSISGFTVNKNGKKFEHKLEIIFIHKSEFGTVDNSLKSELHAFFTSRVSWKNTFRFESDGYSADGFHIQKFFSQTQCEDFTYTYLDNAQGGFYVDSNTASFFNDQWVINNFSVVGTSFNPLP